MSSARQRFRLSKSYGGFTLIELLIVIAILGVLATIGITSLTASLTRGRDIRRKEDLRQMKAALRLYYGDYTKYPADAGGTAINGCGAGGTSGCPCSTNAAFAAGGSGCSTLYQKQFSQELGTRLFYYQLSSGDDFLLKANLENTSDPDLARSQARCPGTGSVTCGTSYCVCAD